MTLDPKKASLMWKTLNETRGKIEPTEYKNYIFGIMFYKYLSEKAENWLSTKIRENDISWSHVYEKDPARAAEYMKGGIGYVIQPGDFYRDWQDDIAADKFNIMEMTDAIGRFQQTAEKEFSGIFGDLDLTSTRLGSDAQSRTATVMSMIHLMSEIEYTDDQDTVGDIYEYLIGMFAENSGAKAGEFYTPHEVSEIMARIMTDGREDSDYYSLYDPTVGSGSLLLTTAKKMTYSNDEGRIKYYGQEVITTTYNLARMNLIMHGVSYHDIDLRNGDTLRDDWPDGIQNGIDSPRMFDAVMSNPPYSQNWDNQDRESDPRFRYGVAPKGKADYAFLLHGLYHLKDTGRMAIVLPHGVLFRGAAEGKIRENLLNNNNIDAIIGLPEKIFTNTGIPTIIMILRKDHVNDNVLFIDASKGFEKQKNSNKLRNEDIDKIVGTYLNRTDVDKYAHVATMDEIKENDYNLNIPRYVDTFEEEPPVDAEKLMKYMQELDQEEHDLTAKIKEDMSQLVATDPDDEQYLEFLKQILK